MELGTTTAGSQIDTFSEVIDILSQKDNAIEKLISTMEIKFIPENIRDDTQMKTVTNCIEIEVQKPSSPMEQQMTFNHYKNVNTFKDMIGITPTRAISFISELFTGHISDKEVFIRSKMMNHLEPNDVVMADKGFLIANELEKIGSKLHCPIFLEDKI
ncbi:uncharacterized protein TNCV_3719721 [Trichonephila clavipes]|nr:uncharacterized protein TNCV_3719721 [Trichonephila clavipes]